MISASSKNLLGWLFYGVVAITMLWLSYKPSPLLDAWETTGFLFGILWIWFLIKESPWCWPAGIISSSTYVVFLLKGKVYGDAALNVLYVVMGVLGWYWWVKGSGPEKPLPITQAGARLLIFLSILVAVGTWILYPHFLKAGSDVALIDAMLFFSALAAQFLQARKKIDNWPIWIAVDLGYVAVFIHKGYIPTAVLSGIYGLMAIKGWLEWRKRFSLLAPA